MFEGNLGTIPTIGALRTLQNLSGVNNELKNGSSQLWRREGNSCPIYPKTTSQSPYFKFSPQRKKPKNEISAHTQHMKMF